MWGRPRIFAIGCGPILEGATIPRRKRWYLRLWILSLSSLSPILRPCFLRSTSSRRTSLSTISCSRTTSPIPSSRLPMSAIRVSSSRARSKKDGGLYFGPYPDVGAANEIKRLFLDRIFPFRKCTNPPSKVCFYYHLGQCMAHTVCHKDEAYFKSMAQEVSDFLKGQDDKIIDDLKLKMTTAAQNMEFERAAEYRDLIQAIGTPCGPNSG